VNDEAIRPKRNLTITSIYVTDGWTNIILYRQMDTRRSKDRAYAQHFVVENTSNSVNVLLHCLNNTHLLTAVPS